MSERGSFTTQYIYVNEDYITIRQALDQKDKYLCISSPATWSNGNITFEMPIVSGKVGDLVENFEWKTIVDALEGVKTSEKVRVVVMCDAGDIMLVTKDPDGEVYTKQLIPQPMEWE